MTGYVYSVGLVPVQEWIAEARRSRDLKAGSAFLAYVMWRILSTLETEGEIRLPAPPPEGFRKAAPVTFADALEMEYGIPNRATGELRENLEERIDRLFSEVKRTRPVRPWKHRAPVGKCNQCGKREAMGPQDRFDAWRDWSRNLAGQPSVEGGERIDAGERLCYVCLAKRIAGYPGDRTRFPSTGEVAVKPWLDQVEARFPGALDPILSTSLGREDLGRALLDGEARLRKAEAEDTLEARQALFQKIRAKAAGEIPSRPPSYLALLAFDGDSMGRWVHQAPDVLPADIERFAGRARALFREAGAAVFYLAGDEGLAMAPAASALDLAHALDRAFHDMTSGPTLSMGVAFFEYSRPMRGAIEAARNALRQAKKLENKNALGVAVETASGNRWGFAAHWSPDWDRVRNAVRLVRDRKLSAGWAHDAESFLETLPVDPAAWNRPLANASREEVKRLFFRRLLKVPGRTAEERVARRREMWAELPGEGWWPMNDRGQVERPHPEQLQPDRLPLPPGGLRGAGRSGGLRAMITVEVRIEPLEPLLFGDNRSARSGESHALADQDPSPATLFGAVGTRVLSALHVRGRDGWHLAEGVLGPFLESLDQPSPGSARLAGHTLRDAAGKPWFPAPLHLRAERRESGVFFGLEPALPAPQEDAETGVLSSIPNGRRLLASRRSTLGIALISTVGLRQLFQGEPRLGLAIDNVLNTAVEGVLFSRPPLRRTGGRLHRPLERRRPRRLDAIAGDRRQGAGERGPSHVWPQTGTRARGLWSGRSGSGRTY